MTGETTRTTRIAGIVWSHLRLGATSPQTTTYSPHKCGSLFGLLLRNDFHGDLIMRMPTGLIALSALAAGVCFAADAEPVDKHQDLQRFFQDFSKAFHTGDAQALGGHFAENGRYINGDTGAKTEGREAISKLHADVFRPKQVKAFEIELDDVRLVTPDVATVDATATLARQDAPAANSLLHAVLVRKDGKWLLDSLQEASLPAASPVHENLQSLSWMIGDWQDSEGELEVETTCHWSLDHTFIDRTYTIREDGKQLHQGTQKIAFDAVDGVIRSWAFESDGSFGEGLWTFNGEHWTVKMRGRTAVGLVVGATQVITLLTADSYTTQLVSRELGGKLLANGPLVKVERTKK